MMEAQIINKEEIESTIKSYKSQVEVLEELSGQIDHKIKLLSDEILALHHELQGYRRRSRMSTEHELKILPVHFRNVLSGVKTFEIRKNDRGFKVGDSIILNEWVTDGYTGAKTRVEITCMYETIEGIESGYCVLGIQ